MFGGGGAAALGLGIGGGGANAKLSRERKHRMRELATQKLSRAYYLDEIAASVATMQSASSLENVAKLVLQRSPNDSDAKYVHFFHEKIPSRMMAQCTDLDPLDQVIHDRPTDGAPLRTRAVTRIFKDDYAGAARDLTEGLAVCRYMQAQHQTGERQMELARKTDLLRDGRNDVKIDEEDQPSSLEPQILFHRAGVYLTLACQHVKIALDGPQSGSEEPQDLAAIESQKIRIEGRKGVKTNAKRALRDYTAFLACFEYTPGIASEIMEEFFREVNSVANGLSKPRTLPQNRLIEMSEDSNLSDGHVSGALVPQKAQGNDQHSMNGSVSSTAYPKIPPPKVHQISALFSATPPSDLPPYPVESKALVRKTANEASSAAFSSPDRHEVVTYHPLLTDALHSLLLCHSLVQTSPKEHLRHAHMVARLARICDGYPIFLAARSPSRADWIEVIRRAKNWIGLDQSWESLCAPAPLPGRSTAPKKEETEEQARERRRQEAIMEALADERVHDEATFQATVAARERRAEQQFREDSGKGESAAKRWTQEDGKEYPISTERAEAVARWVREAPLTSGLTKPKKGPKKAKGKQHDVNGDQQGGGVENLEINGHAPAGHEEGHVGS